MFSPLKPTILNNKIGTQKIIPKNIFIVKLENIKLTNKKIIKNQIILKMAVV